MALLKSIKLQDFHQPIIWPVVGREKEKRESREEELDSQPANPPLCLLEVDFRVALVDEEQGPACRRAGRARAQGGRVSVALSLISLPQW